MISCAQEFEDDMPWHVLGHVDKGVYIDMGDQDPVVDFVSLAFYACGWRGVHVEPCAACAQGLRGARPDETVLQAAIGEVAGLIPFYEIVNSGLSTGNVEVAKQNAARIDAMLQRVAAIAAEVGRPEKNMSECVRRLPARRPTLRICGCSLPGPSHVPRAISM